MRLWLALLLLAPVSAQAAEGYAVSGLPTPLSAPLVDDAPDLSAYENLVTQTPVPEADKPAVAAPRHRRPSVRVLQGNTEVKRGRFVENGVIIYRGLTPAQ